MAASRGNPAKTSRRVKRSIRRPSRTCSSASRTRDPNAHNRCEYSGPFSCVPWGRSFLVFRSSELLRERLAVVRVARFHVLNPRQAGSWTAGWVGVQCTAGATISSVGWEWPSERTSRLLCSSLLSTIRAALCTSFQVNMHEGSKRFLRHLRNNVWSTTYHTCFFFVFWVCSGHKPFHVQCPVLHDGQRSETGHVHGFSSHPCAMRL